MCSELSKSEYEQDCKPLAPLVIDMSKIDPAAALRMVTAIVMPTLPDALKEQAQRDCETAIRGHREDDDRDDTRAEELAAWKAARAENDGEDTDQEPWSTSP